MLRYIAKRARNCGKSIFVLILPFFFAESGNTFSAGQPKTFMCILRIPLFSTNPLQIPVNCAQIRKGRFSSSFKNRNREEEEEIQSRAALQTHLGKGGKKGNKRLKSPPPSLQYIVWEIGGWEGSFDSRVAEYQLISLSLSLGNIRSFLGV